MNRILKKTLFGFLKYNILLLNSGSPISLLFFNLPSPNFFWPILPSPIIFGHFSHLPKPFHPQPPFKFTPHLVELPIWHLILQSSQYGKLITSCLTCLKLAVYHMAMQDIVKLS